MSSLVTPDATPNRYPELDALRSASLRIRSGERTDPSQIERTLELGFAAMIGLEAKLSRLQPRATACDDAATEQIADLKRHIAELSDALTELRTLSVRPGESRVGFGFVLPAARRRHNEPKAQHRLRPGSFRRQCPICSSRGF
jgi:hypothetical protein